LTFPPRHRPQRAGWSLRRESRGLATGLIILSFLSGCGTFSKLETPERIDRGYTVILPGIEGKSYLNTRIAKGLVDGGFPGVIEVYDWTAGSVVLFPITLRHSERNRSEARKVARKLMDYQDQHPDQPVHLIGHSGGGGLAVLVLEALPADRAISSAILLAPAIAPDYDLRRGLRRTRSGIWNFYSPYDVGFLKAGTTVMGTIDGQHTSAAGAVGFTIPWGLDKEDRQLYAARLHQQRYTRKMAESGHLGNHTGWANRRFVADWIAPLIHAHASDRTRVASDGGR
jgi:pimeloyl-ACP methyl ester carboxylesterase